MKKKGFFSREFIVLTLGLIFSILFVGSIYRYYVWPIAEDIEIASRVEASQNPDQPIVANRSVVMILKDMEQMFCLMLMLWACIIISYKFLRIYGERSVTGFQFLRITKGERILPDEALAHYKELGNEVSRNGRLRDKILPDVILSALHRFDSTRSIQDASHAVQQRTEMAYDQLESELSLVRYIAWAIPSVGFIGTVRGIGEALALADEAIRGDISGVTAALGLAFNSTLIALLLSIVLMFFVHLLQSKQEKLLIDLEEFATKRIIGLMKTPENEDSPITYS
ncbi:MotA/TolQ/ExbB proton channel family protein [Pelagicoccus sp. SDUM812003]|uniref:MotA/TolQ/ExbB proton channel family protein n=1 Tax=Pelagicoccus sp. SDUM812003 TaxID=3041267 RepID=UPI00280E2F45|nr:MotA/TolQ/ExbB proton channel family protein [Pelagicoccus sp. SDUM812003]MDQ8203267.1 MotA/TolQ/ExbB proton channel family protein [Pelagicoccus sp. SDUM812003]